MVVMLNNFKYRTASIWVEDDNDYDGEYNDNDNDEDDNGDLAQL